MSELSVIVPEYKLNPFSINVLPAFFHLYTLTKV